MEGTVKELDEFYGKSDSIFDEEREEDEKIIIMGDWNVRIGEG